MVVQHQLNGSRAFSGALLRGEGRSTRVEVLDHDESQIYLIFLAFLFSLLPTPALRAARSSVCQMHHVWKTVRNSRNHSDEAVAFNLFPTLVSNPSFATRPDIQEVVVSLKVVQVCTPLQAVIPELCQKVYGVISVSG